jgi:DNA uptake protein ComE-like DNA-binding protein
MKHFPLEPLKNWFGYTRRERRSSFILLILIVTITGIRFLVPDREMPVKMIIPGQDEKIQDTILYRKPVARSQQYRQSEKRQEPKKILDINTCDSAMLEALPGIGPVLSARIVKYRNLLGGYASVDQLREVYGLTEETFNLVSGRLTADPSQIRKIDINTADYKQLIRLPYFEKYEVTAILKYRELNGKVHGIKDLIDNKLINEDKAEKVKYYLEFGE